MFYNIIYFLSLFIFFKNGLYASEEKKFKEIVINQQILRNNKNIKKALFFNIPAVTNVAFFITSFGIGSALKKYKFKEKLTYKRIALYSSMIPLYYSTRWMVIHRIRISKRDTKWNVDKVQLLKKEEIKQEITKNEDLVDNFLISVNGSYGDVIKGKKKEEYHEVKDPFNYINSVYHFKWDNALSKDIREYRGEILAKNILDVNKENIKKIYIAAHSHGSNVVIQALLYLKKNKSEILKKIIFISVSSLYAYSDCEKLMSLMINHGLTIYSFSTPGDINNMQDPISQIKFNSTFQFIKSVPFIYTPVSDQFLYDVYKKQNKDKKEKLKNLFLNINLAFLNDKNEYESFDHMEMANPLKVSQTINYGLEYPEIKSYISMINLMDLSKIEDNNLFCALS